MGGGASENQESFGGQIRLQLSFQVEGISDTSNGGGFTGNPVREGTSPKGPTEGSH